ncbi:putative Arginine transporter [Venustampulla echinocandica]|uniref:Putative Arginine transporter n=1 Tax=Venustampulla echinocandica TaxID=2656787 RepID=A0A370TG83_9HELO|nr:putative Arginine transporter [Venustampulla echinocandica]RDL33900.1 putative Arginine transporter [Venustampulla echinocandica]
MGHPDDITNVPSMAEKPVTGEQVSPVCDVNGHFSDGDVEKRALSQLPDLKRKLKSGTLGTGLFIGSGQALAHSGPAGALIAYAFVGTIVYSVMQSLGEMATYIPISGAFTSYATRFVDPSLGFAMGWVYWFSWAITFSLELTATGLIIQYWNQDLNIGIFIGVFWPFITFFNLLPVSFYGELEFWFSSIKVITVIGFLIFAICIDAGAGQHGYLGFHTWGTPGAFAPYLIESNEALAKFVGFWAVLIQAGFSYQGTELVGIAAGETENPRKNVPAAIKKTFYRILFFFIFTVFFIGLLIPYDNPDLLSGASDASASPFVIAAVLAGVDVLPGLINAILLTVVLSAANSNVYSGSRILVGLAHEGMAPRFFKRTSKQGVPIAAVLFTAAFGLLAFLNLSNNGATVFDWLLNISSVAGFITWACINGCHIAFMRALKARNMSRDALPYKAMWQPWYAWYGLFFNILIIFTQGFTAFIPWDTTQFFIAYVSLILFVVLYLGHKILMRTKFVKALEADLDTGCLLHDETTWSINTPTTFWGKMWAWI